MFIILGAVLVLVLVVIAAYGYRSFATQQNSPNAQDASRGHFTKLINDEEESTLEGIFLNFSPLHYMRMRARACLYIYTCVCDCVRACMLLCV